MSTEAEKLFWQNRKYNTDLAKRNAKPRNRNILISKRRFDGVDPDEVLERLSKVGIQRDKRTLQRYAKMGLIPKPETKSLGQGKGKIADYPENTPEEFYSSIVLLSNYPKLTMKKISLIRTIALRIKEVVRQDHESKGLPDLSVLTEENEEEFFSNLGFELIDKVQEEFDTGDEKEDNMLIYLALNWNTKNDYFKYIYQNSKPK